jgi:hypothetical protein
MRNNIYVSKTAINLGAGVSETICRLLAHRKIAGNSNITAASKRAK